MTTRHEGSGSKVAQPAHHYREGDRVITPSDEVAFVEGMLGDTHVRGTYADALSPAVAEFTLHHKYLVRWDSGKPRPKAVRMGGAF